MKKYEMNYISLKGRRAEIIAQIYEDIHSLDETLDQRFIEESVNQLFTILEKSKCLLEDDEIFERSRFGRKTNAVSYVSEDYSYYISIRKATLAAISAFLPSKFSVITEIFLQAMEIPTEGTYFLSLNEFEGELCILLEARNSGKKGIDVKLFEGHKGECVNNQYHCRFNQNGICVCEPSEVKRICEKLEENGVVRRKRGKYYYLT